MNRGGDRYHCDGPPGSAWATLSEEEGSWAIPDIPDELVRAMDSGSVAVFVGAGVSMLAGLPGWKDLADVLLGECRRLGYAGDDDCEACGGDPKRMISLAHERFREHDDGRTYDSLMTDALGGEHPSMEYDLDGCEGVLEFLRIMSCPIVTTNADRILEEMCVRESGLVLTDPKQLRNLPGSRTSLIHIHGICDEPGTMVFTEEQYLIHDDEEFSRFLDRIFREWTVLFIGYGMGDEEILRHILPKEPGNFRHFALVPFKGDEAKSLEVMRQRTAGHGIVLIPYCVDGGYGILNRIAKEWVGQIRTRTMRDSGKFAYVRGAVSGPVADADVEDVRNICRNDVRMSQTLLRTIPAVEHPAEWFVKLSDIFFPERFEPRRYAEETWLAVRTLSVILMKHPSDRGLNGLSRSVLDRIREAWPEGDSLDVMEDYARILAYLEPELVTDEDIAYLECCSNVGALHPFAYEDCRVCGWLPGHRLRLFGMLYGVRHAGGDSGIPELFCERHADRFVEGIGSRIMLDSVRYLARSGMRGDWRPLDLGAISVYPDDEGVPCRMRSDFDCQLIHFLRLGANGMDDGDAEYMVSELIGHVDFAQILLFIMRDRPVVRDRHLMDLLGNGVLRDQRAFSELYDFVRHNSGTMSDDMVEGIVEKVRAEDNFAGQQTPEIVEGWKGVLLSLLAHRSESARDFVEPLSERVEDYIREEGPYSFSKGFRIVKPAEGESIYDLETGRWVKQDGWYDPDYLIKRFGSRLDGLSDADFVKLMPCLKGVWVEHRTAVVRRLERLLKGPEGCRKEDAVSLISSYIDGTEHSHEALMLIWRMPEWFGGSIELLKMLVENEPCVSDWSRRTWNTVPWDTHSIHFWDVLVVANGCVGEHGIDADIGPAMSSLRDMLLDREDSGVHAMAAMGWRWIVYLLGRMGMSEEEALELIANCDDYSSILHGFLMSGEFDEHVYWIMVRCGLAELAISEEYSQYRNHARMDILSACIRGYDGPTVESGALMGMMERMDGSVLSIWLHFMRNEDMDEVKRRFEGLVRDLMERMGEGRVRAGLGLRSVIGYAYLDMELGCRLASLSLNDMVYAFPEGCTAFIERMVNSGLTEEAEGLVLRLIDLISADKKAICELGDMVRYICGADPGFKMRAYDRAFENSRDDIVRVLDEVTV